MSATSPNPSFKPGQVQPWSKDSSGLAEFLREVSLFFKSFRLQVGEHSRLPLRLLRFNLDQGTICCDWVARDPDPWDLTLPPSVGMRHASLQALKDAIDTRSLLFQSVQGIDNACIRAYRRAPGDRLEPILFGNLRRQSGAYRSTRSLAMRAKLMGFRFRLDDEILIPLKSEDGL